MKEISLKDGRIIKTPWLRIDEAAAYCGLSRTAFTKHAQALPHGGDPRTRLYDEKILDAWIRNELPDIPFTLADDESAGVSKKKGPRTSRIPADMPLIHPRTGKVYASKEK